MIAISFIWLYFSPLMLTGSKGARESLIQQSKQRRWSTRSCRCSI